jgi:hypothetical protein
MLKFKFPFQNLETIPKLIKDFLQQEIPQFSSYQFTLENALLKQKKKNLYSRAKKNIGRSS